MSGCAMAMSAAISAVVTPIQTTAVREDVTPLIAPNEKSGYTRATRNTPAATIVAAWINALTGVGPSIASGSHTCNGNCPDLPKIGRASCRERGLVSVGDGGEQEKARHKGRVVEADDWN